MRFKLAREPKLPSKTKGIFDYFIHQASKDRLHPSEWENFYEFISAYHDFRVKLDETELVYLLEKEGFTEKYARELANVYYHIREFLKSYKRRNYKHHRPNLNLLKE